MRDLTNRQLLVAVVVFGAAATLFGLIDVVQGALTRGRKVQLQERVQQLERDVEALRAP